MDTVRKPLPVPTNTAETVQGGLEVEIDTGDDIAALRLRASTVEGK